jgi:hypothetical protein
MKTIILFLCILGMVTLACAVAAPVERSVTMNLAFAIGPDKAIDSLQSSQNYSLSYSAQRGAVVAMVSNGEDPFNATANSSYSAAANLISAEQAAEGNEFLIVFTNGSSSNIADKQANLGNGRMVPNIFGDMRRDVPDSFPLYMVLGYDDIDLQNDTVFSGAAELIIRNFGSTQDGKANITFEVM